jgi:hypothetical protein
MRIRRALLVLSLLLVSAPALAYLLPGWSLVKKSEQRRETLNLHSLQVQGTLLLTGDAAKKFGDQLHQSLDQGQLALPAVASFKYPGRCRIELPTAGTGGKPLAMTDRNGALGGAPELTFLQPMLTLGCPLLTSRGGDEGLRAMVDWMKTLGVDFQTASLSRMGSKLAEVVGAEARDLSSSQVWIDKDEFVPLRVIAKLNAGVYDVRYLDLGAPGSGAETLPRIIELWQLPASGDGTGAGQLVARFTGAKADPNATVDDGLF